MTIIALFLVMPCLMDTCLFWSYSGSFHRIHVIVLIKCENDCQPEAIGGIDIFFLKEELMIDKFVSP